ncbi:PREDICTED: baculoviral IAP repeat-containing protein 5 isoform X2 [Galeopterus variegatus]|uniref:Baculoviral IAP repeat-containing protein 5 n=1 Tax=Galeopterus variegatus TaxID=482537 RepID=A0ABM0RAU0_GALVR|nr:PREDICTED: baculoviral IAP repeat-containing protein 5 isoform X2 [Galeopterus variegatus]
MGARSLPPAWLLYLEDHRISTFKNWPFLEGCACTPERMAKAGFVHCPTENEPDLAQCFFCFKELEGWEPDDDPVQRKPAVRRKNLKKLQRRCAVPLSSWHPWSEASCPFHQAEALSPGHNPQRLQPSWRPLRKGARQGFEMRHFNYIFIFS